MSCAMFSCFCFSRLGGKASGDCDMQSATIWSLTIFPIKLAGYFTDYIIYGPITWQQLYPVKKEQGLHRSLQIGETL